MARVRIGDLLIRAGLIDELQLNAALSHQKQWSGKLGDILVERGFLDEMMLWMGLSKQLNVALVNITTNPIPADVVAVLGAAMCRQYEIFPIALHERTLTVATSDPNNLGALDEVAFRTGTKVKAVLAPAREIEWAIRRYYENDPSQCAPAKQRRTLHGEEMNILSQQQGLRPGAVSASANPIAMGAAQFESQNTYPQGPPTPQTAYPAIQPMGQIALNPSMHAAFPTAPARQAPTHAPQASPPPQPNSASAISQWSMPPATSTVLRTLPPPPTDSGVTTAIAMAALMGPPVVPASPSESSVRDATMMLKFLVDTCIARRIFTREEYLEKLHKLG